MSKGLITSDALTNVLWKWWYIVMMKGEIKKRGFVTTATTKEDFVEKNVVEVEWLYIAMLETLREKTLNLFKMSDF